MANEIRYPMSTGYTLDAYVFRKSDGKVYYPTGAAFETWGTGSRAAADYKGVTLTEAVSGAQYYTADFPSAITTAGDYDIQVRMRAGSTPADTDTVIGMSMIRWTGTAEAAAPESTEEDATTIANYAFAKIGGAMDTDAWQIASINGDHADEEVALLLYNRVRREVLLDVKPQFARAYAELTTEDEDVEKADWQYAFTLPDDYLGDCVQLNETYHASTKDRYHIGYDHEIVQGALLTNNLTNGDGDGVYIKYLYNATTVSEFSPWFTDALATKLAAELSPFVLADKGERRYQLLTEYTQRVKPAALAQEASQHGDDADYGEYSALTCRTP